MAKQRLDILLVEKGLAATRSQAQGMILQGLVQVNEEVISKAGHSFDPARDVITLKEVFPYVSRGALKLIKALDTFPLSVEGRVVLDIGSSTGGFTDVCLSRGARLVYAVDVGTNQLAYKLRQDKRVVALEKTNARYLEPSLFDPPPSLAVCDVSFISLKLIIPVVKKISIPDFVALIKPQFEVGKEIPGFDGVVKRDEERELAIVRVKEYAHDAGFVVSGLCESPITGPKGNVEYLIYLKNQ